MYSLLPTSYQSLLIQQINVTKTIHISRRDTTEKKILIKLSESSKQAGHGVHAYGIFILGQLSRISGVQSNPQLHEILAQTKKKKEQISK